MSKKNDRKETSGIGSSNGFDGWIDVKKQLPTEDGAYLIFAPSEDPEKPFVGVAWYDPSGFGWSSGGVPKVWIDAITHWQPIPPAPAPRYHKFDDSPIPSNNQADT